MTAPQKVGDSEGMPAATSLPAAPPPTPDQRERFIAALHDTFGYDSFRAGQEEVIATVMAGHDTLAIMPTGAGKSLCYQIPALLGQGGVTLVVSPLIALMKDQVDSLPPTLLARTTFVNSQLDSAEQELRLGEVAAGRYSLVYAAPERLRQRPFVHALRCAGVNLVVIDEAHCLSMWGHDFRPDYLFIRTALKDIGDPQVLAMTATATPHMMDDIARRLGRSPYLVNMGVLRDNLYLVVQEAGNDDHKLRYVLPFLERQRGAGIVYVNSRESAERLERELRRSGINARAYHAGLGLAERSALQERFMSGAIRVMVATIAFGMGIDKADVRFIVHYHPPRSLEAYTQESGRAGRDGRPAGCLLLHTGGDRALLKRRSREQVVSIEQLRAVYRAVRRVLGPMGEGVVDAATLQEQLSADGHKDVDLRVAVSMLESASLLRRGSDVPRAATVILRGESSHNDGLWGAFLRVMQTAHIPASQPLPIDVVSVARALNIRVVDLEDHLLAWRDEGHLIYRGVGRDMWLELLPPPDDAATQMAAILHSMSERNSQRLQALLAYLNTGSCRQAFIGRHFGHRTAQECGRCDVCRPLQLREMQPVQAERLSDPAEAVRRLLAQYPCAYGKTGVAEILKGLTKRRLHAQRTELFGALAHLSKASIERTIDELLASGEIVTEIHDSYAMLRLAQRNG